jgi:hypothetical protein
VCAVAEIWVPGYGRAKPLDEPAILLGRASESVAHLGVRTLADTDESMGGGNTRCAGMFSTDVSAVSADTRGLLRYDAQSEPVDNLLAEGSVYP